MGMKIESWKQFSNWVEYPAIKTLFEHWGKTASKGAVFLAPN
jgi:hypothetical protein